MKILSYILSSIFALIFFIILLIFHPIQWIGLHLFGYGTHKRTVDIMNWFFIKCLLILGVSVQFKNKYQIPKDKTIIFVSNHQSMFDISAISWYFRGHHPKFISKVELGKGIPSVSFNLKHGGSVLIDRKEKKQAILILTKFAKKLRQNKWSAVIFPEGMRSKNGKPKSFYTNGLKTLTKYNPDGYVVPLTINNSWKVFKYGKFPLGLRFPIKIITHQPIKIALLSFEELMQKTETIIKDNVNI